MHDREGKSMFAPVNTRIEFPKMEEGILAFWEENDIFKKSVEERPEDQRYVFYDGPPFATGLPHFGHLVPGTIKDAIPRYQTMKNRRVERTFGWDCHGLPVEFEMEKTLGISGYSAIVEYGVAKFNEQCRSIVLRYTKEWEYTINRMGRWVDWENGYRTMDTDYMESIWWVFKTLYEKGYIYEGYNILPFSPALASPLSNFEVNLGGYQDVVDPALTVRFAVDGEENTYFLAWTTTPWTLPSNLALAFGPEIIYATVLDKSDGARYILGKDRISHYFKDESEYEIVDEQKGSYYEGMRYEPLFPFFAHLKEETGAFLVVVGDYVSTEEGTGIVHTAPGFGEDDYEVLKGTGIPVVCPIDMEGRFTNEVPTWEGIFVKDADKGIIEDLRERGLLVKRENYLHPYPFCYRTKTPLIYRALSSWFVDIQKIKQYMLDANEEIYWMPEHLKHGRFGKWLEGAKDWSISRNRFWGNPIPIWKCDNSDYIEVIGSRAELEEKCGQSVEDLHKHFIDDLTWPSPDGKGTMRRIGDVLDCWFESGSMPYAQHHYPFENKEYVDSTFPADFICEGLDQTRGWFYTLTVIAAGLWQKPAFYNCITNGIVLTADGKKMSKSERNYTDPMELVNLYGADSLRFFFMNSAVVRAEDLKFSEEGVRDVLKSLIIPLYNAYSFFVTYANLDGYEPSSTPFEALENPMDRWIISASQRFVQGATTAFDAYDIQKACALFIPFIDDLNNWYIRRSRRRFWKSESDSDKKQAYDTLYRVLLTFIKVAAPIIPFTVEEIYRNLRTESMPESVHLCFYPEYEEAERDLDLEARMSLAQKAIAVGRALRASNNLKIRQPLATLYLVDRDEEERAILKEMEQIIAEELNVKRVILESDESQLVTYSAKANFKLLGPTLGKQMKEVATLIEAFDGERIAQILDGKSHTIEYSGGTLEVTDQMIIVQRSEKEGVKVQNEGSLTVGFDTVVTQELLHEGIAREIIRLVQNLRKEMGFEVSDRIKLFWEGGEVLQAVFSEHGPAIARETLSNSIAFATLDSVAVDCADHPLKLRLDKE
jgi:isoleucyl-tRNA synthetase